MVVAVSDFQLANNGCASSAKVVERGTLGCGAARASRVEVRIRAVVGVGKEDGDRRAFT